MQNHSQDPISDASSSSLVSSQSLVPPQPFYDLVVTSPMSLHEELFDNISDALLSISETNGSSDFNYLSDNAMEHSDPFTSLGNPNSISNGIINFETPQSSAANHGINGEASSKDEVPQTVSKNEANDPGDSKENCDQDFTISSSNELEPNTQKNQSPSTSSEPLIDHHTAGQDSETKLSSGQETKIKPKRKRQQRTVYTIEQVTVLEKKFWKMQYLTLSERAELAAKIGLSQTQVCNL